MCTPPKYEYLLKQLNLGYYSLVTSLLINNKEDKHVSQNIQMQVAESNANSIIQKNLVHWKLPELGRFVRDKC